ncbi:P-loop containing nucleoside triphosphate hydrolase protein [Suillus ampliporus]|nr:P-loop containing nucleoside triphosphate hydrolase protein [Suillus ampliporus]
MPATDAVASQPPSCEFAKPRHFFDFNLQRCALEEARGHLDIKFGVEHLVQQLLQLAASNTSSPNTTVNDTSPSVVAPAALNGLGPLISFFLSVSALRDWAKLLIIGSFFETCRRLLSAVWSSMIDSVFLTASFEDQDDSYKWMMVWLSQQPAWKNVRNVNISTVSFGEEYSGNISLSREELDPSGEDCKLSYLPAASESYILWYKYRWMQITRISEPLQGWGPSHKDTLKISIITRNHDILNAILKEAKNAYQVVQGSAITVYVSDSMNCWRELARRKKRPLDSIILEPGIQELVVEDAKDFLASKEWYAERGIPFRRGYLLYGAPGSGKTSLIHSIAGELGLDVYIISLSRSGLDDTGLSELISILPERCIALMEDIDAALHNSLTREDAPKPPNHTESIPGPPPAATTSRVSLSGLLNALDGIGAQEGRILFATTNKYSALDPALCRPGRMDLHVEFKLASKYQADELFKRFYLPSRKSAADDDEETKSSPAQTHHNSPKHHGSSTNLIDLGVPDDTADPLQSSPSSTESEKSGCMGPIYLGTRHSGHAPRLSNEQLSALAAQFASAIPEREVSMAALQGYLMSHKTRPWEAAKEVSTWLQKELADKKARDEMKS